MNFFKLFAHGDGLDVDSYSAADPIGFDRVWHRGDQHYKSNGIEKLLGDGNRLRLRDQDRIGTQFLEQYKSELTELAKLLGLDWTLLINDFAN
ncbi:hypothetical protein K227x_55460 [Rubripirellula lacrimiformis]|uniref:Uncharacterized protein n=1 Tax=Rubripirellula lacrimiformis TaxID=1930273 RepID=A0A517NJ05_9BACT|nr:hypothetical protein [Rubripirellula lacrimiformis]QDT07121.1 hypothetical protein K227x_55460 [Rubripirellula lacrimiformis]